MEGVSPSFSVVMQNTLNEEEGGALHKKIITIKFGGTAVLLSDSDPVVVSVDPKGSWLFEVGKLYRE